MPNDHANFLRPPTEDSALPTVSIDEVEHSEPKAAERVFYGERTQAIVRIQNSTPDSGSSKPSSPWNQSSWTYGSTARTDRSPQWISVMIIDPPSMHNVASAADRLTRSRYRSITVWDDDNRLSGRSSSRIAKLCTLLILGNLFNQGWFAIISGLTSEVHSLRHLSFLAISIGIAMLIWAKHEADPDNRSCRDRSKGLALLLSVSAAITVCGLFLFISVFFLSRSEYETPMTLMAMTAFNFCSALYSAITVLCIYRIYRKYPEEYMLSVSGMGLALHALYCLIHGVIIAVQPTSDIYNLHYLSFGAIMTLFGIVHLARVANTLCRRNCCGNA